MVVSFSEREPISKIVFLKYLFLNMVIVVMVVVIMTLTDDYNNCLPATTTTNTVHFLNHKTQFSF